MDIVDFYYSDVIALPKVRDSVDMVDFLKSSFKKYYELIDTLPDDLASNDIKANKHLTMKLGNSIIDVLTKHQEGHTYEAYELLDEALGDVSIHFQRLLIKKDVSKVMKSLFRMRLGGDHTFTRNEMFHIPFEMSHLVSTQRYSIPGLPCLYFGSSVFVCWNELSKPNFSQIQVARNEPVLNSNIHILDFGYRPAFFGAMFNENPDIDLGYRLLAIAYATCWPLIAACAIKSSFPTAPFKIEYVVPQLLLEWIRENKDYDGIRYFSMNIDEYYGDPRTYQNFAFPAKTRNSKGWCAELQNKFMLTETLVWDYAKAIKKEVDRSKLPEDFIELVKGARVHYRNTDFGYIEAFLAELEAKKL